MIISIFSTKIGLMLSASRKMWQNCIANISRMHGFKAIYTSAYCNERIAEIDQAEAMPAEEARAVMHAVLRMELQALAKSCRQYWQSLKMYVKSGFPQEQWQLQWNAAGWEKYALAGDDNWEGVKELMSMGSAFLGLNEDVLKANDNMPTDFREQFEEERAKFLDKWTAFTNAETSAEVGQEARMNACNAVYEKAILMGEDGQHVFEGEELNQRLFSFAAVCDLLDPKGSSTAVLTVVNAITGLGLIADVQLKNTERKVTSGANGRVEMGRLAHGPQEFVVTADGFAQQTVTMELKTGTTSRTEVNMLPLFGELTATQPAEVKEAVVVEK
jgi:hypothetical protein